jgi:RNA polymerase sigma-70 factor (ECF subfamily)
VAEQMPAPESMDPADLLVRKEVRRMVREELARLPEEYRLPLVYTAIEGLDYPTVAAMLGIPVGTLKTYVFRGKQMLKEKIIHAM